MLEVVLTYPTEYGSEEIFIDADKTSFGRGEDAEYRFEDNGLSRLHASVFREGDDVWITDEYSSNGTFVNGEKVSSNGTPLYDGDLIRIGNHTKLKVNISEKSVPQKESPKAAPTAGTTVSSTAASTENTSVLIPLAVTAFALLIVAVSFGFIGYLVFSDGTPESASNPTNDENSYETEIDDQLPNDSGNVAEDNNNSPQLPINSPGNEVPVSQTPTIGNTDITNSPVMDSTTPNVNLPTGKKYLQMSDTERNNYIRVKAMKVARMIGNRTASSIPPLAVARIRGFADAYAKRLNVRKMGGKCRFGDNLQVTYDRASRNAPFIVRAFNQQGIDPQIGLYLAMIESEHCVCLQSPTKPLGMFQFTTATAKNYGLNARLSSTTENPDDRCIPKLAAVAAAKYMKYLTGRYGTGPSSVPLAIGSYNSGEGGLSKNLRIALESNKSLPRDFWTMIANGEKLSKQFQSENFKYVPKFFAAAIIGENPRDFGLRLQPLSMYGG